MNKNVTIMLVALGAVSLTTKAGADIVYSENFDASGFLGSSLNLAGSYDLNSERWGANTTYNNINNFDGWSFGSGTYMAVNTATGNQGVLLNENGGIANTVVGLTPNAFYTLSFNYSGDNRPGEIYGFGVNVNGGNVASLNGLTWNTVNPAGHLDTVEIQANASGDVNLSFYQTTPGGSQASPIIDDIQISSVPDGGSVGAFMGFGAMGLAALRRKLRA